MYVHVFKIIGCLHLYIYVQMEFNGILNKVNGWSQTGAGCACTWPAAQARH